MDMKFEENPYKKTGRSDRYSAILEGFKEAGYGEFTTAIRKILEDAHDRNYQEPDDAIQLAVATMFFALNRLKQTRPEMLNEHLFVYKWLWGSVKGALIKEANAINRQVELFDKAQDIRPEENEEFRKFYNEAWDHVYSMLSIEDSFILSTSFGTNAITVKELQEVYKEKFGVPINLITLRKRRRSLKTFARAELLVMYKHWRSE